MTTLDDLFKELMKRPGFKEDYLSLAPEFLPLINEHANVDTIAAMIETEALLRDPNAKKYTDVEEFLRDLKA